MSAEALWMPWDPDDPINRGVDAGGVAAVCELLAGLLDHGEPSIETLMFVRQWLGEPRWEHCPQLSAMPLAILRDRIGRELARRAGPGQEPWLLAHYESRGELITPAPDDAAGLDDTPPAVP